MVPQSHLYSRVPQVFWWAFQSDWTAYFLEHLSHFHFFSPCLRLKCFLMPVRSPSARAGLWWTHEGSGHTYTLFLLTSLLALCLSFHGRLCPLLCNCKFWSLWNPLLHISHTNLFVAINVVGDRAITSAFGSNSSVKHEHYYINIHAWENKLCMCVCNYVCMVNIWRGKFEFAWGSREISLLLGWLDRILIITSGIFVGRTWTWAMQVIFLIVEFFPCWQTCFVTWNIWHLNTDRFWNWNYGFIWLRSLCVSAK